MYSFFQTMYTSLDYYEVLPIFAGIITKNILSDHHGKKILSQVIVIRRGATGGRETLRECATWRIAGSRTLHREPGASCHYRVILATVVASYRAGLQSSLLQLFTPAGSSLEVSPV